MVDATLVNFVENALRSGASREDIRRILLEAGWSSDQVKGAMGAFSPVAFPVPVPLPRAHLSARDAFMYLVMFGMLYISAFNLGNLLFQFINLAFPDPVVSTYDSYSASAVRWSTSSLLVAFPVFFFIATRIARSMQRDPTQRSSSVRKWLTYLTLSAAACVVVGDLIYLLNSLLSGELTTRFILKALTVGVISGAAFWYYLRSMRSDDEALAR